MLAGDRGEAAALAMKILVEMAGISGAQRLIDVTGAHIDSCLFHGIAGLDFAERLAAAGGRVVVPTTLNVSSLDLIHPDLYRGSDEDRAHARRLMDAYVAMGCRATWTCAPYQLRERPALGEHVAWAESNAIVFANSVLGARTDRYGDFIDICAALTGRVPEAGLHLDANRRGTVLFDLTGVPGVLLDAEVLYPVLGHLVGGATTGTEIPVIDGLPHGASEDRLKALGAGAASSGAVALFHAVGSTPEAPDRAAAFGGREPSRTISVTVEDLKRARDQLSSIGVTEELGAVSIGTPHFSIDEFAELISLLDGPVAPGIDLWVSTGRDVLAEVERRGWLADLEAAGARMVVDTCTYITPILEPKPGAVMTNSAKWAWYAPGNIGVDVVFGSLEECVRSAIEGRVWRDDALWG
ncbi:MAG: DUF521 domain-containing protein [Actinobacteria bacterium]|nr:DUF521 domain-containing protein [Actinomycetota bacterium]